MQRLSWVLVLVAFVVAGCGGGGGMVAPGTAAAGTAPGMMILAIPARVTSASASARTAQFISPSVASVKISIAGVADQTVSLATSSSACTSNATGRTCTVNFNAPTGQPTITATLLDASANVLGSGSATATVVAGQPFTVNVTINGAISTVTIALSSGFSSGSPGSATVSATASDADGNLITAPGNFTVPVTLALTDTSGSFTLSGTTLAGPTSTVTLTYNGGSPSTSNPLVQGSVAQSGVKVNAATIFSGAPMTCGSPLPLPGSYTTIIAAGNVSGSTFTASVGGATPPSSWYKYAYTQGTPTPAPTSTPTPTPTGTPTASPTPGQPLYIYLGTYALSSGTTGCFYAITSQDGSPLTTLLGTFAGNSGLAAGSPNLPANATLNVTGFTTGKVSSLVVNNLGASGGAGTVSLDSGDSGTVTLNSRFSSTSDTARRLEDQFSKTTAR